MKQMNQPSVSFHTLGCRLNFSETGSIADGFLKRGYKVVEWGRPADVMFLNTCTVTDGADSSCRNLIRKAQKFSPEGKVVVAGCYAQMEAEKIKKMKGVDLILGTTEKYKVFDYLEEEKSNQVHIDQTNDFWGAHSLDGADQTRAFLKIQDGCNYICSFCVIPQARGRSRTISIEDATKQAKDLVAKGFKEIVLTGVNIGEYQRSSGERLEHLVSEVVNVEGLKRLRLSSVEPNTITEELLSVLKDSGKYQDHFHIPLQSACPRILKSMRRKYDIHFYQDILEMTLDYFPNTAFGADIIVGYPGETEQEFQLTYDFLKRSPITHFHVFPYSKRQGTTAVRLSDHLQNETKKQRVRILMKLGEAKQAAFAKQMLGRTVPVLFERKRSDQFISGYIPQFLKVHVQASTDLKNEIREVCLSDYQDGKLLGNLIQ